MDRVEKVSIGGYAFTLEENAFAATEAYLSELEKFYGSRPEGKEIMEGIEERFAELLLEKTGTTGVGTLSGVKAIIAVLGRPDELERESDDYEQRPPENTPEEEKPKRRLYRDVSNKMIGGVCSGLAAYFKVDVAVVRILAALLLTLSLFGGFQHGTQVVSLSAVMAYLVLWLCIPAAKTVRQRWELRGESGSVDEVRKNVEEGLHEVGDFAGNIANSTAAHRLGRAFLVFIGLIFLIVGTSGLTVVGVASFTHNLFGMGELYGEAMRELGDVSPHFVTALSTLWVRILVLLAITLPFIGFLYAGLQLIFNFRSPKWHPGLVIFVLWLIILIVLCVFALIIGFSWI